MAIAELVGWDATNGCYRRIVCNEDGKLIIDPSEIFEDDPTDGETGKAPTSNWAYDHENDAGAHHDKYTDAEARGAIDDLLNASGQLTKDLNAVYHQLLLLTSFQLRYSAASTRYVFAKVLLNDPAVCFVAYQVGGGTVATSLKIWNGSAYEIACTETVADEKISDHTNIVDAHHAKYTDAEAQTACNLDGNLYWSCAGIHFDANIPTVNDIVKNTSGYVEAAANDITFVANVYLPDGATITAGEVFGSISDETWSFVRIKLSDKSTDTLAGANINTEDTTIASGKETVDNSLYAYYLYTSSLDNGDQIYGARITFTL